MPFRTPSLDNRNYPDILRDALARIPVHNPEWTNFNDSDPGMTLLQLFVFMTESILYRANQIPERSRYKFLELLGLHLEPAAAAKGFVTFHNDRGPLESLICPPDLDVRAGQVPFRTTQGLEILPIEARVFYKQPLPQDTPEEQDRAEKYNKLYRELYPDQASRSEGKLGLYKTTPLPPPDPDGRLPVVDLAETVDQCLWIALLARPDDSKNLDAVRTKIAQKTLTVGVMPHLEEEGISTAAGQLTRTEPQDLLSWEIAQVNPAETEHQAHYAPLKVTAEGSILRAPGLVQLTLPDNLNTWRWPEMEAGTEGIGEYPPSLAETTLGNRVITWIRLRIGNPDTTISRRARIGWLGINASQVEQKVLVRGEWVGTGTGEPDQRFRLANRNILPETLELTVKEKNDNQAQVWQQIDDILAADPEVAINSPRRPLYQAEVSQATGETVHRLKTELRNQVFTLDPESGEISFGDGAHGKRPPQGVEIVASYAYGGGQQGNVGINMINRAPELPAGYRVTNPLPTWGGANAQDIATAEKSMPQVLQHRDRLVTVQDFADITQKTPGVQVGRVEIIPLFDPSLQNTLAFYFAAQTDLIAQLQETQQKLQESSTPVTKEVDNLKTLLENTNTLWTTQQDLIQRAMKDEATNEPFRHLQTLFRKYTTNEVPGAVTVMVIPAHPDYRSTPEPDQFFLEAVSDHLCPRRLITTELHIRGPQYRNIWVSVAIKVLGGYGIGPVREEVKQAIFRFLSPLYGGHSQRGWPLKQPVIPKELEAVVARVDGVRSVAELSLGSQPEANPQGTIQAVSAIELKGLMLPRLVNVAVAVVAVGLPGADAETSTGETLTPLENLQQVAPVPSQALSTPIPVLPERC
jgi:hypothetical protein